MPGRLQQDIVSEPPVEIIDQDNDKEYLFDHNMVRQIEEYKKKKDLEREQARKMQEEYVKSKISERVNRYKENTLYEQLKLKEIEFRKRVQGQVQSQKQVHRSDIAMRNKL